MNKNKNIRKINYFYWINAVILIITIGASLLLWFEYIDKSWALSGWDERVLFVFLPTHLISMIAYGSRQLWRMRKYEERTKKVGQDGNGRRVRETTVRDQGVVEEPARERVISDVSRGVRETNLPRFKEGFLEGSTNTKS